MLTVNGRWRCDQCNKFFATGWTFTLWGNSTDSEPPEPTEYCSKCWDKSPVNPALCWQKPKMVGVIT